MRGIVLSLLLLALALPAAASAQNVPPGNSGVDQYKESVPGVGGNRPTGPNGSGAGNGSGVGSLSGGAGGRGGPGISPATVRRLDRLGPDGKATAGIAAATGSGPSQEGSAASPTSHPSSADTGPGMGWGLPVLLALALVAAVSVGVFRWRRGAPPGAA